VGGAVRDAGDAYVRYEDHRQISAGAALGASIIAGLNQEWNDTAKNADPNDPSVAKKFIEERLSPTLEKFQEGFTTERAQQWAESFIDRYRLHMFERTSADMSSLAADAVHVNTQKTANELGNASYNDPSTHGLDLAFKTWGDTIGAVTSTSPNLQADAANKVRTDLDFKGKQHLVRSAIEGAIAKGAPYEQILNDPKYKPYVNQQEIDQFAREAKRQQREGEIQQRQIQLLQKQQAESQFHTAISKAHSDNESYDPATGRVIIGPKTIPQLQAARKAASDSGIDTSPIDTHISWVEAQQKEKREPVVSNETTRKDLLDRMGATDASIAGRFAAISGKGATTEVEIRKAEIDGKLSRNDAAALLNLHKAVMERPADESIKRDRDDFFRRTLETIDPGWATGQKTAIGQRNINNAREEIYKRERDLGQQAHELYDENSPNYAGNLLNKYRATMQDSMKFDAEQAKQKNAPTPTPNRPNAVTVRQNGHIYQRQSDGSYKAID
jgi:hypothetical protein